MKPDPTRSSDRSTVNYPIDVMDENISSSFSYCIVFIMDISSSKNFHPQHQFQKGLLDSSVRFYISMSVARCLLVLTRFMIKIKEVDDQLFGPCTEVGTAACMQRSIPDRFNHMSAR